MTFGGCFFCNWVQPSKMRDKCLGCSARPFQYRTEDKNGRPYDESDLKNQGEFYFSMKARGMSEEKIFEIVEEGYIEILL